MSEVHDPHRETRISGGGQALPDERTPTNLSLPTHWPHHFDRMTTAGVCGTCAELVDGRRECPRCGAPVVATRAAFEAWERSRLEKHVDRWHRRGLIDDGVKKKLLDAREADPPAAPVKAERPKVDETHSIERGADALFAGATSFFSEVSARFTRISARIDADAPPPSSSPRIVIEHEVHTDEGTEAGRALFAGHRSAVVGAGIDALGELDEEHRAPAKPLGALQVFWFIGAVLVLAGSLMGVREAWRSLEGATRPLVIAAALFAYHLVFVALARMLAKRSETTGRVLGTIAVGLSPIAFVAVAVATGMNRSLGLACAGAFLTASIGTLLTVGKVLAPPKEKSVGLGLVLGLVPCLALEVPLGGWEAQNDRLLIPLAALVPLFVSSVHGRAKRAIISSSTIATLGAALYGAIVVALYALFGGPGEQALDTAAIGAPLFAVFAWWGSVAFFAWLAMSGQGMQVRLPRAAPVLRIVLLAVLVGAALASTLTFASGLRSTIERSGYFAYAPAYVAALTTLALAAEQKKHVTALSFAVPSAHAAVALAAMVALPRTPILQVAASGIVPFVLILLSPHAQVKSRRIAIAVWATISSLAVTVIAAGVEVTISTDPLFVTTIVATFLAVAAHVAGSWPPRARASMHYLGGLLAFAAAVAWLGPARELSLYMACGVALVGLAVLYGVGAIFLRSDPELSPLDDLSLIAATVAVHLSWIAPWNWRTSWMLPAAAAGVLALRALRDRSRLVTLQAGIGIGVAVHVALATENGFDVAQATFLAGACALLLLVPAAFRASSTDRFGRALFGLIPLPLGGKGRSLLDGFALAGLVFAAIACGRAETWIAAGASMWISPGRELVVYGLAAVIAGALFSFLTRALDVFRARGHTATLAVGGVVIALTAVAYRIGRPLPPAVVGWRLSIVIALVWLVAQLFLKKGPWIAEKLERPTQGGFYHYVPHAGVLGLSLLLFVDAFLVGVPSFTRSLAVVPPMLLVGTAIGMGLLYRSSGFRPFVYGEIVSAFLASWLIGAQKNILGPDLVPLDPPGGRWVLRTTEETARLDWTDPARFLPAGDTGYLLWERAFIGAAAFCLAVTLLLLVITRIPFAMRALRGFVFGRPASVEPELVDAYVLRTVGCTAIVVIGLAFQPSVIASALLVATGVLAIAASAPPLRAAALALALPALVHSLAHAVPNGLMPEWAGPSFALLALGAVIAGIALSRARGRDPRILLGSQLLAAVYGYGALLYSLAVFGPLDVMWAFARVNDLAQTGIDGRFAQSFALAASILVLALASALAAWSWRGAIARFASTVPPLVLAAAGVVASATFVYTTPDDVYLRLLSRNGPLVGATLGVAGAIAHLVSAIQARRGREDVAWGTRIGRDLVLLGASSVMALFVASPEQGGFMVGPCGIAALGLPVIVAVDAIAREGTKRHVYFVEILVVALYAFATRTMDLAPHVDAMLGLGYGFTLLGVATIARRKQLTGIADATRRFLGVLPLIVAVLTMRNGATDVAALYAVASSVLYAAVAFSEKSRAFGSLAALAANIGLIVFALAQGLDGIEIWLGPLGLLVAALAQIFAPKMSPHARSALRITGGVLLYLPSGLKLALRVGAAEDATYSVIFGAVCLLGVLVGVVLKVRAYLALGTLSLTLDVVANLIYAGLRDHRLGFVILSASGLFILGVMILLTMRRDRAWAMVGQMRTRLRGWE